MSRIGEHRNLAQACQRPRADAIAAPRKKAWTPGVKPALADGKRVDLRKVRSEKLATGGGLFALAANRLGHKQVLQQLLEAHRQFKKDEAESLISSLTEMSPRQLLQVYRNLNDNSSILSAISQTHSDPSELCDFAEAVFNLVTLHVRRQGMEADDIRPKPFDIHAPENSTIIEALRLSAALEAAQKMTIIGGGKPEPRELLKLFQDHPSVFSSKQLWSSDKFIDNYEALGLILSISELRRLASKVDQTGWIDASDVQSLRGTLKIARTEKKLPDDFAARMNASEAQVTGLKTSNDAKLRLFELAKIVADYYIGMREGYDPFTGGEGSLLNLQHRTNLETGLADAETAKAAENLTEASEKLIGALETAIVDFIKTIGFDRTIILETLAAMARGEAAAPLEKLDESFMIMTGRYTQV